MSIFTDLLPERPLEEQVAGYVSVHLGGRRYMLPTLSRRLNRAWKERLTLRVNALLSNVQGQSDAGAIMAALADASDTVVELVREYDHTGVIPPDEDDALEHDTDQEWLAALLQCGAAAYPFVGLALQAQRQAPEPTSLSPTPGPEPTNGRQPSTAGARAT
jgi:hypothetical protein